MSQGSLFGPEAAPNAKAVDDAWRRMRVFITVKAAPNPSAAYGETVCVAGLSLELDSPGWVRLYPINFRDLESTQRFRKCDVVSIKVKPARNDPRVESWKPDMTSLQNLTRAVTVTIATVVGLTFLLGVGNVFSWSIVVGSRRWWRPRKRAAAGLPEMVIPVLPCRS